MNRLTPKRFVATISGIFAVYSFARVCVLFFEALAVVREGRAEDYELLELCQRGDARGSAKMRDACLKARSDLASPVVFKAVVHAVSTAFKDFSDSVGSPFKLAVFALFVLSSVALPVVPWARALFGQNDEGGPYHSGSGTFQPPTHYIAYAPQPGASRRGFRTRVGGAIQRLKLRRPVVDDITPYDSESCGEITEPNDEWSVNVDSRPSSPDGHQKYA